MGNAMKYAGQALVYGAIMLMLGYFATEPAYRHFPEGYARITLTFSHGGKHKGGCRRRTAEEIAKLPPNMRRPFDCPRNRLPVYVQLQVDGNTVYEASLEPTGVQNDGPSRAYKGVKVAAGSHKITVKLRDSDRTEGYDYEREKDVVLKPAQHLVIKFRSEAGGFIF
ncbi:MAG: hypothetical protein ACTSP0_09740 [Alphaproteobacteria bacterium]